MSKLEEFISKVKKDGMARTNRYSVILGSPISVKQAQTSSGYIPAGTDMQGLLLYCDQVQLPGVNYATIQNRTFGELREVPYDRMFETINMSFYVDNNMSVKAFFDQWMSSIQNPSSRTFNYYENYITDMIIQVEDLKDEKRYEVKLFECYPKSVGSIQMDYASKEVMKVQVTMQYKYWISETSTPGVSNSQNREISDLSAYEFADDLLDEFGIPSTYLNDFNSFQNQFNSAQSEVENLLTGVSRMGSLFG